MNHLIKKTLTVLAASLLLAACNQAPNTSENSNTSSPKSSEVKTHNIEFYSTSWCPWCKRAKTMFDEMKMPYVEYDIEADPEAAKRHEKLLGDDKEPGKTGVPLFVINDKVILGFDAAAIMNAHLGL